MNAETRSNVYANCRQRGAKRAIMVALTDLLDDDGTARFVHETIAAMVAIDDATVGIYLRALHAEGEIEYTRTTSGPGSMSEVRMPNYGMAVMADIPISPSTHSGAIPISPSTHLDGMPISPSTHSGYSVHSSQPENPPPTRDVFIPPPVSDKTKTKASSDACRPSRPPTAQQAMVGEVADVIGVDLALIDDVTKSNVCKLAAAFVAADVPPGMPAAAWAAERRRIAGFTDGRAISPPTVARLRTLVGAYRKAQAEGQPADLPPGQRIDPETGRRVVVWEDWR